MTKEEMLAIFSKRHSVRKFKDEAVEKQDIEAIMQAGYLAPCGLSRHESKIYPFYKGEDNYNKLVEITKKVLGRDHYYGAPVILVETVSYKACTPIKDGSAVMENMLLASALLDLGACWIDAPYKIFVDDNKKLLEEIGIDPNCIVIGGVVVGKKFF